MADYHYTRVGTKTRPTHVLIWEAVHGATPKGYVIDHKNMNKRDNRIDNLRCITISANQINSKNSRGTLAKGVYQRGERFRAQIQYLGKKMMLGTFDTEKEASWAYKFACEKYYPGIYHHGSR